ncbi:MAG TPA: hypothetical protein VNF29_08915 [Candidatus Binataceae bacterium]|nr:hypothetical protein [Candidatus Binataceae bacterium]
MAEIIDLAEIAAERKRHRADRSPRRQSLERAVATLEQSLADTAQTLPTATREDHAEILERIERLTMLVRYGMRMLGQGSNSGLDSAPNRAGR